MKEITEDMVEELNDRFKNTIIEFVLHGSITNVVDIVMKKQYSDIFDSYILNLTEQVKLELREFFRQKGIQLMFNNTASCFWATTNE